MSNTLKLWLTFIAVFIFLIIVGYSSIKYWNKEDKLIELSEQEIKVAKQNDSLKRDNEMLHQRNEYLVAQIANIETQKTVNYKSYKQQSATATEKSASEQGIILKQLINK